MSVCVPEISILMFIFTLELPVILSMKKLVGGVDILLRDDRKIHTILAKLQRCKLNR